MEEDTIKQAIVAECAEMADFLLGKNQGYGSSAFEAIGVFSGLGPVDAIHVRIDDKLKRIRNARLLGRCDSEDSEKDLIGYLILKRVALRLRGNNG